MVCWEEKSGWFLFIEIESIEQKILHFGDRKQRGL